MKTARAYANANIALIKYWGKSDHRLNIPAVSSLSLTLKDFGTSLSLTRSSSPEHQLLIDDKAASPSALLRLSHYLEQLRHRYPFEGFFSVCTQSSVPFSAGLASSAAFFAALALAVDDYLALGLNKTELSLLARLGSGSAARSILSGWAGLHGGLELDHEQAFAFPIEASPALDLSMIIAIVSEEKKALSSREAMTRCELSSPLYPAFVASHGKDFTAAIDALKTGSFEGLGTLMEHSTLKMFATMWSSQPAINYWKPQSLALIELIYQIRQDLGPIAYFTMDAGPNVKVLCESPTLPLLVERLSAANLCGAIRCSSAGDGAKIL